MATEPLVHIYCCGGNRRYAQIAIEAGFAYGARLPHTLYYSPLYFADQNYHKPNRTAYMRELAEHKPEIATVLDWERPEQLTEVLEWAEEAAQHTREVLIIPKVVGGVQQIPDRIGGKPVRLAYSVPTGYGRTTVPFREFRGRPVHLLGGQPHDQMRIAAHFGLNVVSVDGNYHQLKAGYCEFWRAGGRLGNGGTWVKLSAVGDMRTEDANYEAFRRSCENIMASWRRLEKGGQPG